MNITKTEAQSTLTTVVLPPKGRFELVELYGVLVTPQERDAHMRNIYDGFCER
jgi:hypothetical protein